jgi:hypothetical protein
MAVESRRRMRAPSPPAWWLAVALLATASAHAGAQRPDRPQSALRVAAATPPVLADPAPQDTVRPRAVVYSDAYGTRLTIHRYGSYAALPLFALQFALGNELLDSDDVPADWVRPTHRAVAFTLGALFVTNTVTGVWNLWESRHDPEGRTLRWLHAGLMLAADAGFVYTATLADDAALSVENREQHRNAALTSIGLATVSTLIMWIWND